ncbi:hypothetical protein ATP20_23510 [Salmonella enterica]|nr:hypothetical protein [Salmonella enterica]EAY8178867.1 hypothetical protein [Salmonella enterica]EBA3629544.1 hypothetical protein [Salmonella enterica]EBP9213685.1 hypothetical protein [Salmonella enterica]EBP9241873.1 hypothetical protein [Salmonella enterica]
MLFDDELRESLRRHEYTQWATVLNKDLAAQEARISDQVWKKYQENRVSEETVRSYLGNSEFIKRRQHHVR